MNKTTDERLVLSSPRNRAALTKMVLRLFEHWSLDPEDQLKLLGYKPASKSSLARLRGGAPVPSSKDKLTRIGKLLSIHKALRILFPYDRDLCYSWVKRHNRVFGNKTALDIMVDGIEGLDMVYRYLENQLVR